MEVPSVPRGEVVMVKKESRGWPQRRGCVRRLGCPGLCAELCCG